MIKLSLIIISLFAVVVAGSIVMNIESAEAFCLFNCAAEDLKNRLQASVDCFERQIMMGQPGRTAYSTEDLDSEGKLVEVRGQWLTDDELKKDWKENPDRHSSNCYFIADITPQESERVYQESLK
ncbi:MAG: hypothetical protein WA941_23530 [Nitrososphaeraceae archaeon]